MKSQILKQMGKRLVLARKAKGYTQENLADLTGLSIKMISSAENGHKAMRPENMIKICECLSISADYLLCGDSYQLHMVAEESKVKLLSPQQREALQNIIDNFFSALDG